MKPIYLLFCGLLCWTACERTPRYKTGNQKFTPAELYALPAFNDDGTVNAVIEIPAGTNTKIEYQPQTERFTPDQLEGRDRVIDFLPYVTNYGFIPGTLMEASRGGDGDALDILVLGETRPTGTLQRVKPIAVMQLVDSGETDTKIIAVPTVETDRIMRAESFKDLLIEYDGAKRIIETWYQSYKGLGKVELKGWQDAQAAEQAIRDWQVNKAE